MQNRKELFKRFWGQLASDIVNGGTPASNRITWLALAMLAFVGEEAVQVLFRRKFGVGGLDPIRIIVCFLLFEIIAVIFFILGTNISESMEVVGKQSSFTWAGVFYLIVGLVVLIKGFLGISKARKSGLHNNFAGESALLSFLGKDGWSQSKIQNIAEPVFTLSMGVALSFVNIFWGIPIIYCAFSVWACTVIDDIFIDPTSHQSSTQSQQGKNFHDVK